MTRSRSTLFRWTSAAAILLVTTLVRADEPATTGDSETQGTRRALIICGLPGDDQHAGEFSAAIGSLRSGLTTLHGFDNDNIRVLIGMDLEEHPDLKTLEATESTQENVTAAAGEFVAAAQPDDAAWVFLIGHSHFDRGRSFFNLPGPDMQQNQFAKLFENLSAGEQVFFITLPASGYYIKPLSREGRVIITATEADLEVNGTLFPSVLADVLAEVPSEDFDVDEDGTHSLFDLYVTVTRAVAQQYLDQELLSTEHANLDDDGDGRGTEVQRDWLTEELGGRSGEPRRPKPRQGRDGWLASSVRLFSNSEPR